MACWKRYLAIMILCGMGGCATTNPAIMTVLEESNLNTNVPPWSGSSHHRALDGKTKRWDVACEHIPVAFLKNEIYAERVRIYDALDEVERILGYKIFDRDSDPHVRARGLFVSFKTAVPNTNDNTPPQNVKGVVSGAPGSADMPREFYDGSGRYNAILYVNIDSKCGVAEHDEIVHEFLHALGLANHFVGFAKNGSKPLSPLAWNALCTLYAYPIGTAKVAITPGTCSTLRTHPPTCNFPR